MIQTVMLSSEFVYRQEFGNGEPDEHGRRMLSPRDASYAISYALTDQSPDEELAKAAAEGRLNTREDYRREIIRMLKRRDRHYLVDPILIDKNHRENVTNMPIRKLRFFREFFGYPKAITIFKDEKRFGLDRLGSATARLLGEAPLRARLAHGAQRRVRLVALTASHLSRPVHRAAFVHAGIDACANSGVGRLCGAVRPMEKRAHTNNPR